MDRPAARDRGAAIEDFVADAFRAMLNREPDPESYRFYVDFMKAGATHAHILEAMLGGIEFHARQRHKWVTGELGRIPGRDGPATIHNPNISYWDGDALFPADYQPAGEAARSYAARLKSGFLHTYCSGPVVLDVGFAGYDNPDGKPALPHAIGIDLDYPGYDGIRLPFADGSVDTIFSSHCLEHIADDQNAIRDWYRVLRVGGFVVCIVPSQALYEKRRELPSRFNTDHKRFYTPSTLIASFERALRVNSYRVRHLVENDMGYDYRIPPEHHSSGAYEIELVIEKIVPPEWDLA